MIKRLRFPCGLEFEEISFLNEDKMGGYNLKDFVCPMHGEDCGKYTYPSFLSYNDERIPSGRGKRKR